jgi:hypothetical protein
MAEAYEKLEKEDQVLSLAQTQKLEKSLSDTQVCLTARFQPRGGAEASPQSVLIQLSLDNEMPWVAHFRASSCSRYQAFVELNDIR